MFNLWKVIIGILLPVLGVFIINYNSRMRRKKGNDEYGGDIQIIGGAILLIIMGLIMLFKELVKL